MEVIESMLNGELSNFPDYVFHDSYDINDLGLEGKIMFCCLTNRPTVIKTALLEWSVLPGDLRLLNWMTDHDYSEHIHFNINISKLLENKSHDQISINSFKVLCNSYEFKDPNYRNQLIKIQEPFSELGILHGMFLFSGYLKEYLDLSLQYKFIPQEEHWRNHLICDPDSHQDNSFHDDVIYVSEDTMEALGLSRRFTINQDIDELRKMDIFPDKFLEVYNLVWEKIPLMQFVICHFTQLRLEEKTIWLNIISTNEFDLDYYIFIRDKDTLDVFSPFFKRDQIIDYFNKYELYFTIHYSIIMLEYFLDKLPEHLVNALKLEMIINRNDEIIEYFFGDVTQEGIDELVRKLIQ